MWLRACQCFIARVRLGISRDSKDTASTASLQLSGSRTRGHRASFKVPTCLWILLFGLLQPASAFVGSAGADRFGEARHPGPHSEIWISTSNPSGLRGKVPLAVEQQCGVHCFSETQLSAVTLPQVASQFRHFGRQQSRNIRTQAGAAAPLRAHSDWAGSWTGVLVSSDWPMHPVRVPWPAGIYETARVQIVQVLIEGFPLLFANAYGYSRGHPQATAATEALLKPITKELVFGRVGPRVICGDLNADEDALLQTQIWRQQGWIEIQDLAWQRWGHIPAPTCKAATRRDFLYLFCEVAALCSDSAVLEIYQEHSTVAAKVVIASNAGAVRCWPRPAEIPWNSIALDGLNVSSHVPLPPYPDSSRRFQQHAQLFEQSLNGHVASPGGQLPACCFGRAKFTSPVVKDLQVQASRASRAGDEVLQSDLLSLEVRRWFKQLRRIQSLRQALQRPSYTLSALEYRGNLWACIKNSTVALSPGGCTGRCSRLAALRFCHYLFLHLLLRRPSFWTSGKTSADLRSGTLRNAAKC